MACILKNKTANSPGIITFTNNEVLGGVCREKAVQNFLIEQSQKKNWIFGIHLQGQFSWVKKWPLKGWENFFLWPETKEVEAVGVPKDKIIPMNCIQFMAEPPKWVEGLPKVYDLCIITRASSIKRPDALLQIVKKTLTLYPNLKVVWIMPDPRKIEYGEDAYRKQGVVRDAFDLPMKLFSATELKSITFICSSTESFGQFPMGSEILFDLLAKSRFALSYSLQEGTPRAWIEALQVGTPILINEEVQAGVFSYLNDQNTVKLKNNVDQAAVQIVDALKNYSRYSVDRENLSRNFSEIHHLDPLKNALSKRIEALGKPVEGTWYLDDLNFRLACHGKKYSGQFVNHSHYLFKWFDLIEKVSDPSDETLTFEAMNFDDRISEFHPKKIKEKAIRFLNQFR